MIEAWRAEPHDTMQRPCAWVVIKHIWNAMTAEEAITKALGPSEDRASASDWMIEAQKWKLECAKAEAREVEALRDVAQLHDAAVETEEKLEAMLAREAALRAWLRKAWEWIDKTPDTPSRRIADEIDAALAVKEG